MDRRRFLGLFSAAAMASIAEGGSLVDIRGNRFVSPAFKLSFDIPEGWLRWTVEEIILNRDLQTYVEEARAENAMTPTPLVTFSSYREPCPWINPGICVYGDRRDHWMGSEIGSFCESVLDYFSSIVKRPIILKPPRKDFLGGIEVSRCTLGYDIELTDGFSDRVIDELVIAFHSEHLLIMQFEQSFDGKQRATAEFGKIESSLQFAV